VRAEPKAIALRERIIDALQVRQGVLV